MPLRRNSLRLLLLLGSLTWAVPAQATFAVVAHCAATSTDTETVSCAATTTGANLVEAALVTYSGAGVQCTFQDTLGNTWTSGSVYTVSGSVEVRIYVSQLNPTVGADTFSCGALNPLYSALGVVGVSGATSATVDQASGNAMASASSLQPASSITPSQSNEFVFFACGDGATSNASVTGATQLDVKPGVSSTAYGILTAYEIQTTAMSIQPTCTPGATSDTAVAIASVEDGGGGGSTISIFVPIMR
jgi:hypothetical protein